MDWFSINDGVFMLCHDIYAVTIERSSSRGNNVSFADLCRLAHVQDTVW